MAGGDFYEKMLEEMLLEKNALESPLEGFEAVDQYQNDPNIAQNIARIEAYLARDREYPDLIYRSLSGINATPGSMLTKEEFKEFAQAEIPYTADQYAESQIPEFAVAFHGHVPQLRMDPRPEGGFEVKLSNLGSVIGPGNIPEDMLDFLNNLNGTFEHADEVQKALGCAVVNTKELLFLTAWTYREWAKEMWGAAVDQNFEMYLEDSQEAASDNHLDRVYSITFPDDNTMLLDEIDRSQNQIIVTKRLVSCVDETQLMNESRRGEDPHNANKTVIGTEDNPGIAAFLEPMQVPEGMNGNPALHYLHTINDQEEISAVTKSTEAHFEHLVKVIAQNNNGVVEVIIDARLLEQYRALLEGLSDNDPNHPIRGIKVIVIDENGVVVQALQKNLF